MLVPNIPLYISALQKIWILKVSVWLLPEMDPTTGGLENSQFLEQGMILTRVGVSGIGILDLSLATGWENQDQMALAVQTLVLVMSRDQEMP
jgi:hypothetical protein